MNNRIWISEIKFKISHHKRLLKNFNKHADVLEKYSKFEPEMMFSIDELRFGGPSIILKWNNKENTLTILIGECYNSIIRSSSYFYPAKYLSINHLKDSDFPEPNIKIIHGDE